MMTTPRNGRPACAAPPGPASTLEAEFPGWRIWQPPSGRSWWATRRGSTWNAPRTVAADTEEELRAQLQAACATVRRPGSGPADGTGPAGGPDGSSAYARVISWREF